jgi:hypothetical protein
MPYNYHATLKICHQDKTGEWAFAGAHFPHEPKSTR